ncbi:DUF1302 domain-containing protein [Cupriavidus necator]|uniref:DUF1302 domain-containing protein n=1 Tax=Cupriavidus necator TaxID=106590 RepID=UPI003F50B288
MKRNAACAIWRRASPRRRIRRAGPIAIATPVFAAVAMTVASAANAFEFDTGNEDLKARWDNTLKYSVAQRLGRPSDALTADANLDDGDRNFRRYGLVSNRVDLYSEFDLRYRDVGMRVSGAAWYDQVYNRANDNNSPATANAASVSSNHFPDATERLHGRKAELLDLFAFGKADIGDMSATGRVGQHTLLYGESLFFGNNGIAAAQSPIDLIKLLSVPNTPFKEVIRPVQQLSGQLQVSPNVAVGGYYQAHWERDRLPGVGSYFSQVDILDAGGERILAGPNAIIPGGSPFYLARTGDMKARNQGQGGVQLRFRPEGGDMEFGFYAARFHAKSPVIYAHPGAGFNPVSGQVGTYQLVFPQDIKVYGASVTTTIADVNVSAEASIRRNMPLVPQGGSVAVPAGVSADNAGNPLYPVGGTAHAQLSWVALLSPSALWQGGNFLGEIAWNRRLSVASNAAALDPNGSRDATAIRMVFQPSYFQVFDGVDLSVPIGVGYGLSGKSSVIHPGFGVRHAGDVSVGVLGDYLKVWKFSLNYTHYFGSADGVITPANAAVQNYSYAQSLRDRDFVSLSISRTF